MSHINQLIILQCGRAPCIFPKKAFLSSSVWARPEYIWKLNSEEILLIYFENCQDASCSYSLIRNRMMNTFIIVNMTL